MLAKFVAASLYIYLSRTTEPPSPQGRSVGRTASQANAQSYDNPTNHDLCCRNFCNNAPESNGKHRRCRSGPGGCYPDTPSPTASPTASPVDGSERSTANVVGTDRRGLSPRQDRRAAAQFIEAAACRGSWHLVSSEWNRSDRAHGKNSPTNRNYERTKESLHQFLLP